MHPAPSVIVFTSLSGLGFGLFFWLGLGMPVGAGWSAFFWFFLAYGLSVVGLLASTFHLGHPERAIKAFSQWRSSWLSREGIAAVATLFCFAPVAIARVFFGADIGVLGVIGALLALATVGTTSMIYTQLKSVPRWNQWTTPVLFFLYALGGGALLAGQIWAAGPLLTLLILAQLYAWARGDQAFSKAGHTMETATGLGPMGSVRMLEPPHTGTNYLLREMVHVVGRKHRDKLRLIATLGLGLSALGLLMLPAGYMVAFLALVLHVIGLFAARWLFFAEAEHVVGLYYGKR